MAIVVCQQCGSKNRVDRKAADGRKPVCGQCGSTLNVENAPRSGLSPERPTIVTDGSFSADVLEAGDVPILLDCWAPWCGPCRMVAPLLDQLAAESEGKYFIAKLNVDENPNTARQFSIQSIPTLLIFKNGALVDRIVGAHTKQAMASRLRKYI